MIKWFRQEHPASCVAACVRMVLTTFGQKHEETEIRQMLGNPRFGLTLTQAERILRENGAIVELHGDWNIDDLRDCLREGNFPIVGIERSYFGHPSAAHAVVVTKISNLKVEFLDSLADEKPQITNVDTFMSAWYVSGQEALIILSSPFE